MAKARTKTRRVYVKAKRRGRRKMTLPLGLIIPSAMVGYQAVKIGMNSGGSTGANWFIGSMTGIRPDAKEKGWKTFHAARLTEGLLPIALGAVTHKIAGKLGINKALGSAGVPWLRI